jgi:hypothetical protein
LKRRISLRQAGFRLAGNCAVAAIMVNQGFTGTLRFQGARLISLLSPFFSNYSTNIKRFAEMLAKLGKACRSRAPVAFEGLFHGRFVAGVSDGNQ